VPVDFFGPQCPLRRRRLTQEPSVGDAYAGIAKRPKTPNAEGVEPSVQCEIENQASRTGERKFLLLGLIQAFVVVIVPVNSHHNQPGQIRFTTYHQTPAEYGNPLGSGRSLWSRSCSCFFETDDFEKGAIYLAIRPAGSLGAAGKRCHTIGCNL